MKIDTTVYKDLVKSLKEELKSALSNYLPGEGAVFETYWQRELELMNRIDPKWYPKLKKKILKDLDRNGQSW